MAINVRRRDFIVTLGGAATRQRGPLAVRAQRGERMRRIGVLMNLVADNVEGQARLRAFQQNLQQLGWSVERNLLIDDAGLGPLIAQKPNRHMREKSRSISIVGIQRRSDLRNSRVTRGRKT
jgi:hypothetical protein